MRRAAFSIFIAVAMLLTPAFQVASMPVLEDLVPVSFDLGHTGARGQSRGAVNDSDSEPNNDLVTATNITGNVTFPGSIDVNDPNDFFRVHLNNTTTPNRLNITLNFTSTDPTVTSYLTILDPDGYRLGEVLCDGDPVNGSAAAIFEGWYYIGVLWNVHNQGGADIHYTLNVSLVDIALSPDGNDDMAGAVQVTDGEALSDALDELTDAADFYMIHLDTFIDHVDVALFVVDPVGTLDLVVEIYTSAGDYIRAIDIEGIGGNETAYFISPVTDDYYFRLWARAGGGGYDLTIKSGTGWVDNDNELANATLVQRGAMMGGNVTDDWDPDDFYRLNLTVGEEVTVNLTVTDYNDSLSMPALNIWLYNATSYVKNSTSNNLPSKGIWHNTDVTGKYYIRIGASDMSFGDYEMLVTILSPPTILPHDPTIEIDEDGNGTLDLLTIFEDPDGGDMAFDVSGNASTSVVIDGHFANITSLVPDWYGSEAVTFTATNDKDKTASVDIGIVFNAVNDAPVAREDELPLAIYEDEDYTITISFLETKFNDVDGDDLTFSFADDENVSVALAVTNDSYVISPRENWNGMTFLTLTAYDLSGLNDSLLINLSVMPVEDSPIAVAIDDILLDEDDMSELDLALYFSDPDGDTLSFDGYSEGDNDGERHIFVAINGTSATLSITPDWHGSERVTFTAEDGVNNTASASVLVIVSSVNDPPVVNQVYWNQYATETWVVEDHSGSFDLSNLFTDVDGDDLTFKVESSGTHMAAAVSGVNLVITPEANWYGMEIVNLSAVDTSDEKVWTDLPVTVVNENDRPVLSNGTVIPESGDVDTLFKFSVTVTDIDGDEPIVSVIIGKTEYRMSKVSGEIATGARYTFEKKLKGGENQYTFKVDDNQHLTTSTNTLEGGKIDVKEPVSTTTIAYLLAVIIVIVVLIILIMAALRRAQRMREFDDSWDDDEEEEEEGIPDDDEVEEE